MIIDERLELLMNAVKNAEIHVVKRLFRSVSVSATELLDGILEPDESVASQECKDFLSFHAKFEELTGLNAKKLLATVPTRMAMSAIWSDPAASASVRILLNNLEDGELLEFAAVHGQQADERLEAAEKLAEWLVDESVNVSPLRFNKLTSIVPTDYHVIRFLINNPIEQKRAETPITSHIRDFVRQKIEAREPQDTTEERSLKQSTENTPRSASVSR